MNLSIHFVLRFQHLCRRLWTALLLAVSLLLLPSGFAAAQITAAAAQDLPIVWEQVLENEDAREILNLISGDAVITEDTAKKPLKAVRKQLQKIY